MSFIDFLAIPFVSHGEDVATIRKTLGENGKAI
jgi:pyruvate kinase